MPGPQRLLLNQDKICRKVKKKLDFEEEKPMRKIRVLCSDPDATDSSSEDEDFKEIKIKKKKGLIGFKRLVVEFHVPVLSPETIENSFLELNCEIPNENRNPLKVLSNAHEVEEPSESLAEEATASSSCVSEYSEILLSPSSPSSVLDMSASTSVAEGCLNSSSGEPETMKTTEPVEDFLEEPFLELGSLFVEEFGQVFHDFVGLDAFPFRKEERNLCCFDLDLDYDTIGWMNL